MVKVRLALDQISMKPKEDPTTLIQQLSDIEAMYVNSTNVVLTEVDKVMTIMSKVPMEYKALLTAKFAEGNATVNDLELIMRAYWRATHRNALTKSKDKEGDEIEKEISLSTFGGTCHKCKKKGHKASNCPTKKSDGNNKVTCSHCGKSGHKIENCWEQNENADKRPKNWKTKQSPETAATTVSGGSRIEVLLGHVSKTMAMSTSFSTLLGPDIWIADSGATTHSTAHDIGLCEVRENDTGGIIVGNGENLKPKHVGTIKGVVCDKQGMEKHHVVLQDVCVLPNGKFNLFSTSKLQKKGWVMYGDDKKVRLTKDGHEILFDIVIDTDQGRLYGMCLKRTVEVANVSTMANALPMQTSWSIGS
jgi:hypothetical protein